MWPLTRQLGGAQLELRAAIVVAQVVGSGVQRQVIWVEPLASSNREALVALIAPALLAYIDGPWSDL